MNNNKAFTWVAAAILRNYNNLPAAEQAQCASNPINAVERFVEKTGVFEVTNDCEFMKSQELKEVLDIIAKTQHNNGCTEA